MPPPTLSPLQTSPFCSSSVSQWSVNEIDPHRFHAVDSSFYSSYSPRSPYISGARSLYSELWPVVPVFGQKRLLCSLKASIFAYTRAWAQCRMRSSRRKKKKRREMARAQSHPRAFGSTRDFDWQHRQSDHPRRRFRGVAMPNS